MDRSDSPAPLADTADEQEQELELEALREIFGDDLSVLDDAPVQLELALTLELGGPRLVIARPWCCTPAARTGGAEACELAEPAGSSTAVAANRHAAAPGQLRGVLPGSNKAAEGTEYVPQAVRYAEVILDERDGPARACSDATGSVRNSVTVQHLPPLRLMVTFCAGYPSERAPQLQLCAQWLSTAQLSALCAELDRQAEEAAGEQVVFTWASWLQAEALPFLGLDGSAPLLVEASTTVQHDCRAVSELDSFDDPEELLRALEAFNSERSWWGWQQVAHTCPICISEKPGTAFCKFGACCHTFCTECISEMMRVHISEGTVTSLTCPLPDCRGAVGPKFVHRFVDEPGYQRWRRLQVQKILNELPTMVFCPRCQQNGRETPVLCDAQDDPSELPLAICDRPDCGAAFCAACREGYHPTTRCAELAHRLERLGLVDEASKAATKKVRRQQITDELQSLKLILSLTVPCPKCKMPITRSQGCNHMICSNCRTHFCYRCGKDITEQGYAHFSAKTCPTFDREEVERLRDGGFAGGVGEDALEDELEELRRQYPEQVNMVWNFRPPPGAWRRAARQRQPQDVPCPSCRQWNPRGGTNNHVRCRSCKTNFCYACRQQIHGTISLHFRGAGACPQHARDE